MAKLLVFGGTCEGRRLVEYFADTQVEIHTYVATEYGESLLPKSRNICTIAKRLNQSEMEDYIRKHGFDQVIDATHPYAAVVSENLFQACENTVTPYQRILRKCIEEKELLSFDTIEEAVAYLQKTEGNIALTTGSKDLHKYMALSHYKERCFARVLSVDSVVKVCKTYGFEGKNLCCMQGPFSEEFNYAYFKEIKARFLVTKESGMTGGFPEKIAAAKRAGVTVIVIGRPEVKDNGKEGFSYEDTIRIMAEKFQVFKQQKISFIGIGMGNITTLTMEARAELEKSDAVIGSKRMIEDCREIGKGSNRERVYVSAQKTEEIVELIQGHREWIKIAVVFSGDIGFCSGAKSLLQKLKGFSVRMISGISTPVYFLNKLGVPWEEVKLVSMHGKKGNLIQKVRKYKKVFVLLGGSYDVEAACEELCAYGCQNVTVTVGERLSYLEERVVKGMPEDLKGQIFDSLSVLLIENEEAEGQKLFYGMADDAFLRGKVPMTKREIRCLSLNKLELSAEAVVYDIGAGTGSVAIEAAKACEDGRVYAIEKNQEGTRLILENKKKIGAANLTVIEGDAPECLSDLEMPTHVFIGGSSGKLQEIVLSVLCKNASAKIVLNAISLETIEEVLAISRKYEILNLEMVQVTVAESRALGSHHMMMGQNPIMIISFMGKEGVCYGV